MRPDVNFFKSIYNDDVIYHYTKASTAIDFILYHNQLRFSKARKSIDPIESKKANRGTVYNNVDLQEHRTKEHLQDVNKLHRYIDDLEERFNLVCFCKNKMGEDFASQFYTSTFEGHEELFGFTKLRMWDQYADKFSGVCIALSKQKVLSLNAKKFDLISGDVEYFNFQDLFAKKVGDIQGNYLLQVGIDNYEKQIERLAKKSFFSKHIDYSGEQEYRIGAWFDKEKCGLEIIRDEILFNETVMLYISGCIVAIFVSSFANSRQKDDLLQYSYEYNIDIIEMEWQHNSFKANDYKRWSELVQSMNKKNES